MDIEHTYEPFWTYGCWPRNLDALIFSKMEACKCPSCWCALFLGGGLSQLILFWAGGFGQIPSAFDRLNFSDLSEWLWSSLQNQSPFKMNNQTFRMMNNLIWYALQWDFRVVKIWSEIVIEKFRWLMIFLHKILCKDIFRCKLSDNFICLEQIHALYNLGIPFLEFTPLLF